VAIFPQQANGGSARGSGGTRDKEFLHIDLR
jgi:hypothetical protein